MNQRRGRNELGRNELGRNELGRSSLNVTPFSKNQLKRLNTKFYTS